MGILLIILPSTLFYYVEGTWTYLDCVYYTFVSLTTIGFGDLTHAKGEQAKLGKWIFAYKGFTIVWLIFGLGFISMNNILLANMIKEIANRLRNFNIIPQFMSIPGGTQAGAKKSEGYEMNIFTKTARSASEPVIYFSACGSHCKQNLRARKICKGRSLKVPPVITYDMSEDKEDQMIINAELNDLRKKIQS